MSRRSNPIPGSIESVPGYPRVKLYKIPASGFFQTRALIDNQRITRTTGTAIKSHAIKKAKEFYDELLLKKRQNLPLTEGVQFEKTFRAMVEVDRTRIASGARKQSLVDDALYIFEKDLLPFFRHDNLKNINFARIQEYVVHLQKRNVGAATIRNHFIHLRKCLKYALRLELLDKLPAFPTVTVTDNPRTSFDQNEYEHLKVTISECIKDKEKVRKKAITNELLYLTIFMVNSFLRPQDLKELRNRDIAVVRTQHRTYLRIMAKGKVKPAPVITLPLAVEVYEALTKFNKKLGFAKPHDFAFFPALKGRAHAMKTMQLQFNHVLEKAGLKTDVNGQPRVLYSLRHTCIMFRLTQGNVDRFTLARNCRTSVEMIDRFYSKYLDPEMNVDGLHSFKPGQIGQPTFRTIPHYKPEDDLVI
jgi:site-specific recombinase XerC